LVSEERTIEIHKRGTTGGTHRKTCAQRKAAVRVKKGKERKEGWGMENN
jgi:hypothetical protein